MAREKKHPRHREYQDKMLLESERAPGGVILYYADGDEEIIHVNQYVIDLFECESVDEFLEITRGSFKGFVYADDVDASEESIQSQLDAGDSYGHIYYRIKTKSGKLVNVNGYGRLIEKPDGPNNRPVFHAFIMKVEQGGPLIGSQACRTWRASSSWPNWEWMQSSSEASGQQFWRSTSSALKPTT